MTFGLHAIAPVLRLSCLRINVLPFESYLCFSGLDDHNKIARVWPCLSDGVCLRKNNVLSEPQRIIVALNHQIADCVYNTYRHTHAYFSLLWSYWVICVIGGKTSHLSLVALLVVHRRTHLRKWPFILLHELNCTYSACHFITMAASVLYPTVFCVDRVDHRGWIVLVGPPVTFFAWGRCGPHTTTPLRSNQRDDGHEFNRSHLNATYGITARTIQWMIHSLFALLLTASNNSVRIDEAAALVNWRWACWEAS